MVVPAITEAVRRIPSNMATSPTTVPARYLRRRIRLPSATSRYTDTSPSWTRKISLASSPCRTK